jgi:hypothetical protein
MISEPSGVTLSPRFLSVLVSVLLHRPFGMGEDRVQHHLLSRDQLFHLGVMTQHGRALRMAHAALGRFDIGLLLGDEEWGIIRMDGTVAQPFFLLAERFKRESLLLILFQEIRVGCTLGMLLWLDRPHRLAYILGEILEIDGNEGSAILGVRQVTFRKRLERPRTQIVEFMQARCGLANPGAPAAAVGD